MKPITVTQAKYLQDYTIRLNFSDGSSGNADLQNYLDGEIFQPLKNKDYFKNFFLDTWTIGWENGADFAPEFLFDLVKRNKPAL